LSGWAGGERGVGREGGKRSREDTSSKRQGNPSQGTYHGDLGVAHADVGQLDGHHHRLGGLVEAKLGHQHLLREMGLGLEGQRRLVGYRGVEDGEMEDEGSQKVVKPQLWTVGLVLKPV